MENIEELKELIKELEEKNSALQEELKQKDYLINHLPCTISWINSDLRYIAINNALEDLIGIQKKSIENQRVGFIQEDESQFTTFIKEFFLHHGDYSQIEINETINGKHKVFLIVAQKYKNSQEAIIIGFDITQTKLLESKLWHNDKLKTIAALSTGIIHEIKNPLSIIKGTTDLLIHHDEFPEEKKKSFIQKIDNMTDRIFNIIDGLKNLARDDYNDNLQKTKISKILEELDVLLRSKIISAKIDFRVKNLESIRNTVINCIEGQIIQILINLINNSIEAISDSEDRWIRVEVQKEDKLIHVKVTDSGPGIKDEDLEKIFLPFFTTKPKETGTGIGLGLCKDLAIKNKADLYYEPVNGHTSFTLVIPYEDEE
ncbi:ATP-binding protein [Bacteriovorax sp. Seq25_V]|uniref:ATP-binding protein n=1 Tax=Bacteriovorax sp. Seq25_V TaxID=1201288 RepID=UPI00038A0B53|nr:HAMP domain-containing sensor histidine kinase [Bacteriovorax sp. Seq25_V]EQC46324.1 GHKL domain protein [Bacteriovorax sp. Seq25_V]